MSQRSILIVDDSIMSRMVLTKVITDLHPDWKVEVAENADAALALVATQSFDIFTIDFNMPGINGLELAELLKPLFPYAKMALLTANVQQAIRDRASALDIKFIAKPITADNISAFIG